MYIFFIYVFANYQNSVFNKISDIQNIILDLSISNFRLKYFRYSEYNFRLKYFFSLCHGVLRGKNTIKWEKGCCIRSKCSKKL